MSEQLKGTSIVAAPPPKMETANDTHRTWSFILAGGGVTLRGSDGQLHPRAPPKPLRVSTVFANAIPPPPTDRDYDPSSFYDELVIQVKNSSQITYNSVDVFFLSFLFIVGEMRKALQAICKSSMESLCPLAVPGATVWAERSCGPTSCRGEVAEPRPPHRDFLWVSGGSAE